MDHYDIIIIGTGAGGATLAHKLAPSGKKILLIERGPFLTRETENWDPYQVFENARYRSNETWYDKKLRPFHPGIHYYVGGNTKVYGSVLFRFREQDFNETKHYEGISPAWPLKYETFEPYYTEAEKLFHVHGTRGEDPTEPFTQQEYPYSAISHEPLIQKLSDHLKQLGFHPFHLPLGILLNEKNGIVSRTSPCIRCNAFDGYPCPINAKADAETICIHPLLKLSNVTLLTEATVIKLETDASGKKVRTVHFEKELEKRQVSSDIVVVSCGAINSAALLLRSANNKHPHGLANSSDLVGRNYMRHNNSVLIAITRNANNTVFQKTLGISDFYFGAKDIDYPLGQIQMLSKTFGATLQGQLPAIFKVMPKTLFNKFAKHSMDFWLTSEDLPDPENRVFLNKDKQVVLQLTPNNMHPHKQLIKKWSSTLRQFSRSLYFNKTIPIEGTAHQCGTLRFGKDPKTSVLDINCKAHDLDNLYVVDGSFFVSSAAVNPSLTIIANALRVGDHLLTLLK